MFLAVGMLSIWQSFVYSQSTGGADAINAATSEVRGFYNPLQKLIWVVAACLGLVGAVRLYYKFTSSDPESSKHAAGFLGGGIALFVGEVFLRKMFLE